MEYNRVNQEFCQDLVHNSMVKMFNLLSEILYNWKDPGVSMIRQLEEGFNVNRLRFRAREMLVWFDDPKKEVSYYYNFHYRVSFQCFEISPNKFFFHKF